MAVKTTPTEQFPIPRSQSGQAPVATGAQVTSVIPNVDTTKPGRVLPTQTSPGSSVITDLDQKEYSLESGWGSFETLFNGFDLTAQPVYNFWTPDETVNDRDGLGNRKLEDVPRYVLITWNPAPELQSPLDRNQVSPSGKDIPPVAFGREIDKGETFTKGGIDFSPEHLQPLSFQKIKGFISDGFFSPGVLKTTVEIPSQHVVVPPAPVSVDEDNYLRDPALDGISIQELISHTLQNSSGISGVTALEGAPRSAGSDQVKGDLFDGSFSVASTPDGFQIGTVDPAASSVSLKASTADTSEVLPLDPVARTLEKVSGEGTLPQSDSPTARVNFHYPSIGGIVSENKIGLASAPEHVENIVAIGQALPQLEVISQTDLYDVKRDLGGAPAFVSPPEMDGLEYVGYILEKYARSPAGVFLKVEEIDLPSREYDSYVDTKILYGTVYRYRIKALARWTHPAGVDPNKVEGKIPPTAGYASSESTYLSTEWSERWGYGCCIDDTPPPPPDELTVRPESHFGRVVVTAKLPGNPQRDINRMMIVRIVRKTTGENVSDWKSVAVSTDPSGVGAPANILFYDYDVDFYQRNGYEYLYAAVSFSRHGEVSQLSEQIVCRLNSQFQMLGEIPVVQVSCPGSKLEYFGAFSFNPPRARRGEIIIPGKNDPKTGEVLPSNFSVSLRNSPSRAPLAGTSYILRIESLDTGQRRDMVINSLPIDLPARVIEVDSVVQQPLKSGDVQTDFKDISLASGGSSTGTNPPAPTAEISPKADSAKKLNKRPG